MTGLVIIGIVFAIALIYYINRRIFKDPKKSFWMTVIDIISGISY
jgi:hypothetical protein